jgi:hypothetical protein
MPGGPFIEPPCQRCGSDGEYFSAGLCARCHLFAPQPVRSCLDCLAWGATRHNKWRCRACLSLLRNHPLGTCASCRRTVPLNHRNVCRLCWCNAQRSRDSRGDFDPITPNRDGQQLFFADMAKGARAKSATWSTPEPTPRLRRWPVTHRQLVLFAAVPDLGCGRTRVTRPPIPELAAALDVFACDYARQKGWDIGYSSNVSCGIRVLLGLQDTPGAPITTTEAEVLGQIRLPIRSVCDVLAAAGMLEDDRPPAVRAWFERKIIHLPESMVDEIRQWFDVMLQGSTVTPRRHPRSETTARLYIQWALPALETWAVQGHTSLREISRADVLEVLPAGGVPRANAARALGSIFKLLKARKLVFVDPTMRLRAWVSASCQPLPLDTAAVRGALMSPNPARAAIAALAVFHGVRSGELRQLRLTDVRDGRLHIGSRTILLAEPVRSRIADYLKYRNARWSSSDNAHLFIHFRTAARTEPVGIRWIFLTIDLPGGIQALREDRILNEAHATGGDTRRLCDLFGLSITAATRYTATVDHPDLVTRATSKSPGRDVYPR